LKRLSTGMFAALVAVNLGLTAIAAPIAASAAVKIIAQATDAPSAAPADQVPAPDFGSPPSGEVPILFNDHHVYSRPDRLRAGRVLSALVRGDEILVPLRSMFEQMGASVSFDDASKSVDVTKQGADVKVTVGKPEVVVNGESRPLDVPPEIYHGAILVPLRVISEGMGAYVQWIPEKRTVVVRYFAAPAPTPPPPPEETPTPAAPPSPTPTPSPPPRPVTHYEKFVAGDYLFAPSVYNNLDPGTNGKDSFEGKAAAEFPLFNIPWMLEGDYTSIRYPHDSNGSPLGTSCATFVSGCANGIGAQGEVYVPSFQARNDDFEGRFGLKVADPRIYIGIGYLFRNTNYEGGAFETQMHGFGGGLDKLPDLDQPFSLYGSVFYYPSVTTNSNQNLGNGNFGEVQYRILKYKIGATVGVGKSPIFLDLGFLGDRENDKQNASGNNTLSGPYAGLGIHF